MPVVGLPAEVAADSIPLKISNSTGLRWAAYAARRLAEGVGRLSPLGYAEPNM